MNDPLSDVLTVLEPRSVRGTSLEAGGTWALSFDGRQRLKFVAVLTGRCWLVLPDRDPEALVEGDVILLSNISYTVASHPTLSPPMVWRSMLLPATTQCVWEIVATRC